jgi:hypothetical protein
VEKVDKISEFVESMDQRIRRDGDRSESARDYRQLKLSTVISRCGWSNRSAARMELLTARLGERGLHCDPSLTTEDLDRDHWIRVSRMLPPLPVQTPPTERDLIAYIQANHRLIPPLDQYGPVIGAEYRLPSGRKVDLVIKDARRRRWLVIEVENKGAKNREAPAQLCEYMAEVNGKCLPAGYEVEGMIISAEADPRHVELLMGAPAPGRLHWLVFGMQLQLQPAPGSVQAPSCDL